MTRYIQNGCETHLKRGKNPPSLKLRCDAPSFSDSGESAVPLALFCGGPSQGELLVVK